VRSFSRCAFMSCIFSAVLLLFPWRNLAASDRGFSYKC